MASFRVIYQDGSIAKNRKVTISVNRGSIAESITDSRGYVSIPTSTMTGKIFVGGRKVHDGSLAIAEVIIR